MDIWAPSYYADFRCLADRCAHNCCIGWEIDVDEETLEWYRRHSDIYEHICLDGTPHFRLAEHDRCPFLNDRNLCRLIIDHGEGALCQICRDHPRFRNFFESRTEIGLGLTCETAVQLVLKNDFSLVKIDEDGEDAVFSPEEEDFFDYREALLGKNVTEFVGLLPNVSVQQTASFLRGLERLNEEWDAVLDTLDSRAERLASIAIRDTVIANRLFQYFLFRHLHTFGLAFCVFCTYVIMSIDHDTANIARLFSSEVEYSDDNLLATAEWIG